MSATGTFHRYMTEAEEKLLFSTVKQTAGIYAERDHAWMRLLRATGIRVGALSQLTCHHARQALATGHLQLGADIQKGEVAHTLFVTKAANKALRDLLRLRKTMGHGELPDAPLILSRNHNGLSIRSFQSRLQMWRGKAGLISDVTPHWFRHTVAKRIMKNSTAQDPRGVVQGVLGHKSSRSTSIYTQPDKEDVEDAMRQVC